MKSVALRLVHLALISMLPAVTSAASTISVVGTEHLAVLDPAPDSVQRERVVEALASFRPTAVCIEAVAAPRLEAFEASPSRYSRVAASRSGERIMLIVGAAHRPFIEEILHALRWIKVEPAHSLAG
jgi:pheromone shutdown protein TraB